MIHEFIRQFTDYKFTGIVKHNNNFFLADKCLEKLRSKISHEPFSIGLFLGTLKPKKRFVPSPALIDLIAKHSDKKVFVNDKAEWLFICKKDIFGKSVLKANSKSGFVLVQNMADENLGYGKITAPLHLKNKVVIKNILDKGEYLRIER